MKKIGIITNQDKDEGLKYTGILADSIKRIGGEISICSDIAGTGFARETFETGSSLDNSDMIICLGGDGTFLKAARQVYEKNIPILGINLGSLGFLTEVDKNEIEHSVERIMREEYDIEERIMLEASIIREGKQIFKDMALNDIVISRVALSRILQLKTYINNSFVDSFPGDGLIISSPTGSTAYSLSAGGPIVEPDIDVILITPICPHLLYSRSFITTANRVVKVVVDENYLHNAMVTVDGQQGYEIRKGDTVEIRKALNTVKLVRLNSRNFFHVLRTKIYNRGEKLRKDEV